MREIDIKLARYETARVHLIKAVKHYSCNIRYKVVEKATNNYCTFKHTKPLQITKEGCNKTIYRNAKLNRDARAWHDMIHLEYNLDFSLLDESTVAEIQYKLITKYLRGLCVEESIVRDASQLILIDVVHQREHYQRTGMFLHNQEAFVLESFLTYLERDGDLI